jgi:glycosyltransferase involved in cell wall biosynthesis
MKYDIAVVMATYNRPELLQHCLACLAKQTLNFDQYQVIVISDGPGDETACLIKLVEKEFPALNILYGSTDSRQGPAAARNMGWRKAEARLIAFTDDDCLPQPFWLEAYLHAAAVNKDRTAFTGKVIVPRPGVPTDYEMNIAGLESADFITANCCCPLELLVQLEGFDTSYTMAWREDSDLHFNLLQHKVEIIKVPSAEVIHPVRKARWGVSLREQKKSMFNALLYRKYPRYYRSLIAAKPVWRYYVMIVSCLTAVLLLLAGYRFLAVLCLINWLAWVMGFVWLRLRHTSKSPSHICEMVVTSFIIPFSSVYWTLYGAIKYKVFFL